ncbi:MAG: hypothetical protein JST64_09620 [Actinobacteria bacterium]|nr:hypothetical protein [Actinomycetota bacterium]
MAASTSTTTDPPTTGRQATPRRSRAVLRDVEPGSTVDCAHCGERVKFQAKVRHRQVICNVYVKGVWNRVEHFHSECYSLAGEPHGPVDTTPVVRTRARAAERRPA